MIDESATITGLFAQRQAKLVAAMASEKLDALLITHLPNIRYLFNFTGSVAIALVTLQGSYLVVDSRYWTQAQAEALGCKVLLCKPTSEATAAKRIRKLHPARLGFEARHMSYSSYDYFREERPKHTKLVRTDFLVENLRMVKDASEIEKIRRALAVTWQSFDRVIPLVKPGVREKDLALELEYRLLQAGAAKLSFDTIIASGYRSAMPHGKASMKKIEANEFVTFDFGIYMDGYASDMTRTLFVGQPKELNRKIYSTVLEAMNTAIENARPGLKAKQIDRFARAYIEDQGFGKFFGHSTGHGIGLEVHEPPAISKRGAVKVKSGMVFTIEPGIYVPEVGGVRIEDVIAVTESGCDVLTQYPKELITL